MKDQLLAKIYHHTAVVAVVGLGYVGLPLRLRLPAPVGRGLPSLAGQALAAAFAGQGFPVAGIDVDHRKVAAPNRARS